MLEEGRFQHVRCDDCNARLFDTTGEIADGPEDGIEVLVKCWRCKSVCVVYLAGPDSDRESMLYLRQ